MKMKRSRFHHAIQQKCSIVKAAWCNMGEQFFADEDLLLPTLLRQEGWMSFYVYQKTKINPAVASHVSRFFTLDWIDLPQYDKDGNAALPFVERNEIG